MKIFALLILSISAASLAEVSITAPSFRILSSRTENGTPEVHVRFANGVKDVMVLERYNPFNFGMDRLDEMESCAFIGYLKNHKETSSLAISGCLRKPGDKMSITLKSPHTKNYLFSVDLKGNVEELPNPFDGVSLKSVLPGRNPESRDGGFTLQEGDEEVNAEIEAAASAVDNDCIQNGGCSFPRKLRIRLQLGYERSLKNKITQEGNTVEKYLTDVMSHTQAHFKDPSLYTELLFDIDPEILYQDVEWTAENNIYDARLVPTNAGTDLAVWFCDDPQEYGTVGIAYVGVLCVNGYKCSLNEHSPGGEQSTAAIVAHEIGHNCGMNHDFHSSHDGKGCQGLMDYDGNVGWSLCSVYDFLQHYDSQNVEGTCLEVVDATNGPSIPPQPTVTTTTGASTISSSTTTTAASTTSSSTTTTAASTTSSSTTTTSGGEDDCPAPFWVGDGYCDDQNNLPACDYDGGDCCSTNSGWNLYCSVCECKQQGCQVLQWVGDGFCDDGNNLPSCGYDGGDCCYSTYSNWNAYCTVCDCKQISCKYPTWVGDGYCDDDNNYSACDYDGGDCCSQGSGWNLYCGVCECKEP